MKKIYLKLLSIVIIASSMQAQAQKAFVSPKSVIKCYTTEIINEFRKTHPNAETDAQFEAWLTKKTNERKTQRVAVQNYVIPIVFHVCYDGEAVGVGSNVSQAQIQQQVLQLNKDYSNLSNSPYSVAANTGITFVLAQKDTLGNVLPEPGIDRINRASKGWEALTADGWKNAYIDKTVKPNSIWNPNAYVNVWLVPAMNNGGSGILLGFATFPTSSGLDGLSAGETATTAGVVIDHTSVGSMARPFNCDVSWGKGKTLTHELGHFFGLRHIWGDATCGTDYVDDTPVHETANSGVPVHPKPNACGTLDEMFEDYMDYSDDEVMNTFTADQVDRMQTVMLNSPRRKTIPGSAAGGVTVTGGNTVSFANCTGIINTTETGTTGTYPRYKDISLSLLVTGVASGAATVNITSSGTAINNVNYQVLTPTLTFAAGDAYKPIVLRIIDNASVDGNKTINLAYTISGTGVVADATSQTLTINITDDDNIVIGQNKVSVINEAFEGVTGTALVPTGWRSLKSSNTKDKFVVSANGDAGGTGKAMHVTSDTINRPNTYTKGISGAVSQLEAPAVDASQYQSVDSISFKYKVRGRADDYGLLFYSIGDGNLYYWGSKNGFTGYGPYYGNANTIRTNTIKLPVPAAVSNKKFNPEFYWTTGAVATGGDPGLNIDDVTLTATPFGVETAVSSSYGFNVYAGTINKFKSTSKKVIATLSGLNTDVQGITASVKEAGNTTPTVLLDNAAFLRSKKVVSLKPATANTTATYTATFYYTAAEIAAWGTQAPSLKILKVNEGVNLAGNITTADGIVVTPTVIDKLATDGYIAYTANFTGFSQFMLVENAAVFPLSWLSFTGAINNGLISLNWKTASEINNNGFDVLRSTDGVNFTKIGFVKGQNKALNEYSFNDINIVKGLRYYYRLKQTDIDGRSSYSEIVNLTYLGIAKWLSVHPNPVKSKLVIELNATTAQKAEITITDMSGKVVYKTQTVLQGTKDIATTGWSNGVYLVKVKTSSDVATFKVVKE